jgi:hypothetical protein
MHAYEMHAYKRYTPMRYTHAYRRYTPIRGATYAYKVHTYEAYTSDFDLSLSPYVLPYRSAYHCVGRHAVIRYGAPEWFPEFSALTIFRNLVSWFQTCVSKIFSNRGLIRKHLQTICSSRIKNILLAYMF